MKYNFNGKTLTIPDMEIKKLVQTLDLTEQEAIETWLDDNEYTENEQAKILTEKAKVNGVTQTIHKARSATPTKGMGQKRERKPNELKRELITHLETALTGKVDNLEVTNPEKLIMFSFGGKNFKLDLIQHREKK